MTAREVAGSIGGGGDLSGVIDLGTTGGVTFSIGNDGLTDVYRGLFTGTGTIVKVGAGIQSINQSSNIAAHRGPRHSIADRLLNMQPCYLSDGRPGSS